MLSHLEKASIGGLIAARVGSVKVGCLDVVNDRQRWVPVLRALHSVSSSSVRSRQTQVTNFSTIKERPPCVSFGCFQPRESEGVVLPPRRGRRRSRACGASIISPKPNTEAPA